MQFIFDFPSQIIIPLLYHKLLHVIYYFAVYNLPKYTQALLRYIQFCGCIHRNRPF